MTENIKKFPCSLCGSHENDDTPMLQVNDMHICGECITMMNDAISDRAEKSIAEVIAIRKTPSKIVEFVNQYVIGQDDAKRKLALAIYNHYKRINTPVIDGTEIQKSNILLIGPSGSGKTYLVQSIAKFLDLPYTIADATTLTEAGFVGEDVESILQGLITAADGDVNKASKGIVFIDEADKIAKKSLSASNVKDPGGEGVQQALLKMIEGTVSKVLKSGSRKTSKDAVDEIDTSNILFICSGAFVGLDDIIKNRTRSDKSGGMGFAASFEVNTEVAKPESEDLHRYGLIPEFVGRLPVVCVLDDLTVDDLVKILVEPKNSIVKQFTALAKTENATLSFTDDALRAIAEKAHAAKTGARGLRSVVESILSDTFFDLPDQIGKKHIEVLLNTDRVLGVRVHVDN